MSWRTPDFPESYQKIRPSKQLPDPLGGFSGYGGIQDRPGASDELIRRACQTCQIFRFLSGGFGGSHPRNLSSEHKRMKYLEKRTGSGKHHLVREDDGTVYCKMRLGKRYVVVSEPSTPRCHMCHNNWLKENRPAQKRYRQKRLHENQSHQST
jgi:hypothetical protein